MTASLVVAGYETIGGTTNPEYRLAPGWDFGEGEPDQATITSLYLDGETLSGLRTTNRTMTLPILVRGTTAASLSAFVTNLLVAVSASTFTVRWTPDGGLPVVFDCYRASWSRQSRSLTSESQGEAQLLLTFQARPFGRSPDAQTVAVISTLQIDSFDTAPTNGTLDTTIKFEGTGSASFSMAGNGAGSYTNALPLTRSYAAKDLSAYRSLSIRFYQTAILFANFTVAITLGSTGGSTRFLCPVQSSTNGAWALNTGSLTSGTIVSGTGVDLTAVTSESIVVTVGSIGSGSSPITGRVDDLRAMGTASTVIGPTSHGIVLTVPVSVGSARTPVNLALSNGSTVQGFLMHSPPTDQDSLAQILSALSNALTDQTITISATNGRFNGTYVVYLAVDTLGAGSSTVTVTVTQQQSGSNVGAAQVLTKTYAPFPRIIAVGEVTLPIYDVPADNNTTGYTIRVQITGNARYSEVMLGDTRGQTVYTDGTGITAAANVYVDEPGPLDSAPAVYAGASRAVARGVLGDCWLTGGPIVFQTGLNKMLAWVDASTPTLTATYFPRWIDERVS